LRDRLERRHAVLFVGVETGLHASDFEVGELFANTEHVNLLRKIWGGISCGGAAAFGAIKGSF
jgi:hypothetical protein